MTCTDTQTALPPELPPELLLDYATGAAAEPVALVVATYLELNPAARAGYAALNSLGGMLLDSTAPASLCAAGLDAALARLDREVQEPARPLVASTVASAMPSPVPGVLRPYIGSSWECLRWRSWVSGVEEYVLDTRRHGYRTSLLRISPGKAMPVHTHAGDEFTLVLDGAYTDEGGRFGIGQLEVADSSTVHRPIADATTGCVCLAVLSAPVQLTGMLGWIVNPFLHH